MEGTGIKSCIKRNYLKSPLDYSTQFLQSNSEDSEYLYQRDLYMVSVLT